MRSFFITTVLLLLLLSCSNEDTVKDVISETFFEVGSDEYESGLEKRVSYSKGSRVFKVHEFYRSAFATMYGIEEAIVSYDVNGSRAEGILCYHPSFIQTNGMVKERKVFYENGSESLVEIFWSDEKSRVLGTKRSISTFSPEGMPITLESFHTDVFSFEKGFDRAVTYFDEKGRRWRIKFYFKDKLVNTRTYVLDNANSN